MFTLLVIYQLKHFLCDYPLQGKYMLGKFKRSPECVLPLLAHVSVHGVATFFISFVYLYFNSAPYDVFIFTKLSFFGNFVVIAVRLAAFDMIVHYAMDFIKANPDMLGRFKPLTATSYQSATWMTQGLSMVDGKPMPTMDKEVYATYKNLGKKDLKSNTYFWWSLGLDQGVHHLTHYVIIYWLVS